VTVIIEHPVYYVTTIFLDCSSKNVFEMSLS